MAMARMIQMTRNLSSMESPLRGRTFSFVLHAVLSAASISQSIVHHLGLYSIEILHLAQGGFFKI